MTYELKNIFEAFAVAQKDDVKAVLVTLVHVDGSSYRRTGVRMLVLENGQMIGAVSGGCVEKEVYRQSLQVFRIDKPRMMIYDGRYRLGCEGLMYILLEIFHPGKELVSSFCKCLETRESFKFISLYDRKEGWTSGIGSRIKFAFGKEFPVSDINTEDAYDNAAPPFTFSQIMPPCFKLVIIGAEYDAVQLCLMASINGWDVTVVTSLKDPKTKLNFPGVAKILAISPDEIFSINLDMETAVVLMTHNFAKDLNYLLALSNENFAYLGILGPAVRKEKLLADLLDYSLELEPAFLNKIHGPAGLNIGAETPQEIAISIISEILSVVREQAPISLNKKEGGIHDSVEKQLSFDNKY